MFLAFFYLFYYWCFLVVLLVLSSCCCVWGVFAVASRVVFFGFGMKFGCVFFLYICRVVENPGKTIKDRTLNTTLKPFANAQTYQTI